LIDAGLSRKGEAVEEGRRAVELLPLAEDAVDGAATLSFLAMIYAWTGDINAAMEQLQFLAKTPGGPPVGYLKYDPAWDAVRSDPRFEPMLKSIEPH
jgi:serine/threonine-protein kinase